MANHCKVMTDQTLDPEKIAARVNELNTELLAGLFTLEKSCNYSENSWVLHYQNENGIAIEFWLTDKDENYHPVKENSVIEFRHGHSFNFMWWVEGVIRENLANDYKAYTVDEGSGGKEKPCPEKFKTFNIFCNRFGKKAYEGQRKHYLIEFDELIPAEIKEKLLK